MGRGFGVSFLLFLSACTAKQAALYPPLIVGGGLVFGGMAPAQELEQIYYLGVFDPQDQLPRAVYRLRVRGQSSFINGMRFGSGWVPAPLVDTLSGQIGFANKAGLDIKTSGGTDMPALQTGRRLVVFGPEGFREVPRDQRLVIVMGASPEAFFSAVDKALGALGADLSDSAKAELRVELAKEMGNARTDRSRIEDVERELKDEVGK